MGECGCGDFQPDFKFPGPGDITYVISVYPSCRYCNTPAGIVLYAMTPEDCEDWNIDYLPELSIRDAGTLIGVIDPRVYEKELSKSDIDFEGCESDTDLAFREAIKKQIESNKQNLGSKKCQLK